MRKVKQTYCKTESYLKPKFKTSIVPDVVTISGESVAVFLLTAVIPAVVSLEILEIPLMIMNTSNNISEYVSMYTCKVIRLSIKNQVIILSLSRLADMIQPASVSASHSGLLSNGEGDEVMICDN